MAQPQRSTEDGTAARQLSWWRVSAAVAVGMSLGLGLLALVVLFARPAALLFLAMCIACALWPVVHTLGRWLRRGLAILLIYAAILAFVALIVAILIPPIVAQLRELAERLPSILERAREFLAEYGITDLPVETITASTGQALQRAITAPFALLSGLLDAALVLIISLYLLLDGPRIVRFILSLFGGALHERIARVGGEALGVSGGYVRGVVIDMLLVGTVTSIGLTLIGLPFALVLGVVAGLFEALPVVGSLIGALPILLIAALQSPATALVTVVFIVIVQQVQGNIITPHVMNDQANVPRFLVPLVILAGGAIGGVLGALIAVPLTAVLRVLFLRVLTPLIRRQTGAPDAPDLEQAVPKPPRTAPGRTGSASLLLVTLAMTMGGL